MALLVATGESVVIKSAFIETPQEARIYYRARLAKEHLIKCRGRDLRVVFERDATHCFTEEIKEGETADPAAQVKRYFRGRTEVRRFAPSRARLMDRIPDTLCRPALTVQGEGIRNSANFVLYGFPDPTTKVRMCVVLRPGPNATWICLSAYPLHDDRRYEAVRAHPARFPP